MLALLALLACGPEPTRAPDPDPDTDVGVDTADSADPTDPSTGPCAGDPVSGREPSGSARFPASEPDLQALSLTATPGPITTQVELALTLSGSASAAVQCVADTDPAEVFFAESPDPAEHHVVRLSGLLPATTYTCTGAPVCPTGGPAASAVYVTDKPPGALRPLTPTIDPDLGMSGAWTLAPFAPAGFNTQTYLAIWGPDGKIRWWWALPHGVGVYVEARFHPEDGRIVWGGGMHADGRVRVLDLWDGLTYSWAPPGWEGEIFHHDGKRVDDGRLMSLEHRPAQADGSTWSGFGIRAHDPVTGVVDFDFDSQALVDDLPRPDPPYDDDPWHANWMDRADVVGGAEVYVSLCFAARLLAIDEATGALAWQLGPGLGWTVLDEQGAEIADDALPQCVHGADVVGERRFLVYDNGQERRWSSVSEWVVDPDAMTAQRLWLWTENKWYEPYFGDVDPLPGDRALITQARMFGASAIVEVDRATGSVASRLTFADGGFTYRADRYDGCALFDSVRHCPALADRHAQLAPLLDP